MKNCLVFFEIFRQLKCIKAEEILKKTTIIVSAYENYLEDSLDKKLVQFAKLLLLLWLVRLIV